LYRYDKAENLESAIRLFQQALALDGRYTLAYAGLAKAYWQKFDLTGDSQWTEAAKKNCMQAAELDGELVPVRVIFGSILTGTGQYEDAIVEFQKALQMDSSSFDAWLGLAKAYDALGQTEKAEASYRGAIDLQPNVWYGYNALGKCYYNASRYTDAEKMFKKVTQLLPDSARGYSNLSAIYLETGRSEEAVSAAQKSIEIHPSSDGYWTLGMAYFMSRRFPESVTAYEKAVQISEPQHYSIWGNLGDAYKFSIRPGDKEKAQQAYQRAIELANEEMKINPRGADPLIMLAGFYAKVGKKQESLENLHQALERKPDNPHFLFLAGLVYNLLGQPGDALDCLQRSMNGGYSKVELDRIDLDNLRELPRFQQLTQKQ
jgi:tetratricopeptide (TPR) repeat protein